LRKVDVSQLPPVDPHPKRLRNNAEEPGRIVAPIGRPAQPGPASATRRMDFGTEAKSMRNWALELAAGESTRHRADIDQLVIKLIVCAYR
jgi:hypothetical protein